MLVFLTTPKKGEFLNLYKGFWRLKSNKNLVLYRETSDSQIELGRILEDKMNL